MTKKSDYKGAGLGAIIQNSSKAGWSFLWEMKGAANCVGGGVVDKPLAIDEKEMMIAAIKERAEEFDKDENLLDAFHLYRRVLRLDPTDIEALYQLATIYYSADMREKAIECLYAILEIDPSQGKAEESLEMLENEK